MNDTALLKATLAICDLHTDRLAMALDHMKAYLPMTADVLEDLEDEELGFLEIITNRFAKLQDTISQKLFPMMLGVLGEDAPNYTFLDRLNKLVKMEIVDSADFWKAMRKTRNSIAHEYPDDLVIMAQQINDMTTVRETIERARQRLDENGIQRLQAVAGIQQK